MVKAVVGYNKLLDAMEGYHFGQGPLLSLDAAQSDLPHDDLWVARDSYKWKAKLRMVDSMLLGSKDAIEVPSLTL
jgi:hypothetical protein